MKPKITQVSRGSALTRADFIEILKTWLDLYACTAVSSASSKNIKKGLLRVAGSFYVIKELQQTAAAYRVNKAKIMALNEENIDEISVLISEALLILSK